ncbi:Sfi1 spindle body protein-domain-containing protein [Amylostereum chailletii]|nr:Sfi1 spindle body protein-domain-containing protein [Amylostereum chailletii]
MSHFRPIRSSPPPKQYSFTNTLVPTSAVSDVSRSSIASTPELASLTPDEISFIEAVIGRASPSATTFLSVFKAYNDVLQERGLDPQNEVVYYGKLLKLGTLKGANWGEKWQMVKVQYGYKLSSAPPARVQAKGGFTGAIAVPRANAARLLQRLKTLQHGDQHDPAELHPGGFLTQTDLTEDTEIESQTDAPPTRYAPRRAPSPSQFTTTTTNSLGLDTGGSERPRSYPPNKLAPTRIIPHWSSKDSQVSETAPSTSTVPPPSYKTAARHAEPVLPKSQFIPRPQPAKSTPTPLFPSTSPPKTVRANGPQTRARRETAVSEEDAWKKIRMAQDEKDAVKFWEDRLVERCWDVWKQGYEWTVTTSAQIAQARDTLILRRNLQKWNARLAERRDFEAQVQTMADQKRLRTALEQWRAALKAKRQAEWRSEMRARMKLVREKREAKLCKDAWAKWRQLYQSRLSRQHYAERLVRRIFSRWKGKLGELDHLDAAADQLMSTQENRALGRTWDVWRRAFALRGLESQIASKVTGRMMRQVIDAWNRRMQDLHTADRYHDALILKRTVARWKASQGRIRALERRADKHIARSDDVLVRAVARVWKAHERGKLLVRVRALRLLRQAWQVWNKRLQLQRDQDAKALAFASRTKSFSSVSALHKWRQQYTTHQNAHTFATQYHSAQLQFKMLFAWRIALRAKLKLIRKARVAEKYFVMRRAWKGWQQSVEERKREKKLQQLVTSKARGIFDAWLRKALRQRVHKLAEQEIENRVKTRVLKNALGQWTNRVIAIKLRELEVSQKRDKIMLLTAVRKWKAVCIRHVEELNLMESYQDVKREENMRRMFYKWLAAARLARHRRVALQDAETEMRRRRVAIVWDKWHGRFQTEKLLPMERTFVLQNQHALMYRAFVTWHSKTHSLPAVRFHASHVKAKFWTRWRDSMPKALQAKEAREMDKKAVLSRIFAKWLQAYRTKIALRAVIRARNMGLPSAASRPQRQSLLSRPTPQPSIPRSIFPRPAVRRTVPETDTEAETEPEVPTPLVQPQPRAPAPRTGIASLLASRPVGRPNPNPEAKAARPRLNTRSVGTREPSPARSRASRGVSPTRSAISRPSSSAPGRGSLWLELQEIQKRARTPASATRSPPASP